MRFFVVLLVWLPVASIFAQDTTTATSGSASNPNPIVSLASEFFEHDYVNLYGFANGVYDSYAPVVQNGQTVNNGGAFGYAVGGGINAVHSFHDGSLSLSYSGDYRDYQSSFFSSGTDQNLVFGLTKRITRRWSFSVSTAGGVIFYGGSFLPAQPAESVSPITAPTTAVVPNPFSPETRYWSSGLNFAYRQTRRLTFIFSGNFFLQRYNYSGAIGVTGASGSGGLQYQLAPRTSVSGTYTYSHYDYTHNAGQASVNSIGLTLSHQFPSHWMVTVSGGFSQTHTSGVIEVPVTFIVQQGTTQQAVGGYVLGSYDQSVFIPSYSGSVSRSWRHSSLSATAGQGVLGSGNGYYLTSRNTYVTGYYSYSIQRRSNVSFGGYYYRLSSVANTVSSAYSTQGFSANYGTMLMRYVGAFVRYDFVRYGSLSPLPGVNDNRISFGFNFSSKSIPMTLF